MRAKPEGQCLRRPASPDNANLSERGVFGHDLMVARYGQERQRHHLAPLATSARTGLPSSSKPQPAVIEATTELANAHAI
ncbi:hypothetical protein GGQ88_000043 [Novosphingobium hassiacum]|uniref:Uncharacterized protein n=1 Tax=Novosphingobium hassiacum TaxID=173676 RepID=A0A7W5ZRR7_9SPHN|nr:hypothetical protein [Novosphingobium hassiacum]